MSTVHERPIDDFNLHYVERQLKDWFLTRRVKMERAMALRRVLKENQVTGLSGNPSPCASIRQDVLWKDLTQGRPELQDELSINARDMKADMYMSMFKTATDLKHPCRLHGVDYLHCVKENINENMERRNDICNYLFKNFASCRKTIISQQEEALSTSLIEQKASDDKARELWYQRDAILNNKKLH